MVAKQTKKRATLARKAKTDPVQRARAEVAKGIGGVAPALVAMVADWSTLKEELGDDARADRADDAEGFARLSELHRAIYLFPARTVADLCAKLPVLRAELQHHEDEAPSGSTSLNLTAWRGVIADLERLCGSTVPTAPSEIESLRKDAAIDFEPWAKADLDAIEPPTAEEWTRLINPVLVTARIAWKTLHRTKAELIEGLNGLGDGAEADPVSVQMGHFAEAEQFFRANADTIAIARSRFVVALASLIVADGDALSDGAVA